MPSALFPAPPAGEHIRYENGKLIVPDRPVIPFVEGDGTGPDIWAATVRVLDAAVEKAYGGRRKIVWYEIFAGEKAYNRFGEWLPEPTVDAVRKFKVAIKGPLTTPVGGGIRSLNVSLRQLLDLFACVRPVCWIPGVPSPVKRPQDLDVVIFRENTEDVYAGIEWKAGTPEVKKLIDFLGTEMGKKVRPDSGIGIKPMSAVRLEAPRSKGDPLRARPRPRERYPRPQGEHHEVHRGGVPRLGVRGRRRLVRRPHRHRGRARDGSWREDAGRERS